MNVDYVIVQAGGEGRRLRPFTRNMPKALVPVNNLPIIFHLFRKYPDKKFVIIGDYKCDVLERYMEIFADVEYISIKAKGKGNAAGLRQALSCIPSGESFALTWTDLILGDGFSIDDLPHGNYIGISETFQCSWSCVDGVFAKKNVTGHGVAGFFLFEDKAVLRDIPESGSFMTWLSAQNIALNELIMCDTAEVGTPDALKNISNTEARCRPYNKMTFGDDTVVKEALTNDAQKLLQREIEWYEKVSDFPAIAIPKIISTAPLTMERIHGDNICLTPIDDARKPHVIKKMVDALRALHEIEKCPPNAFDMAKDYFQKTLKRVRQIAPTIPFSNLPNIKINGREMKNPLLHLNIFRDMTQAAQRTAQSFGIIHGDCTFSNTLIDADENIFMIDARGYFGNTKLLGDVDYDWAKMYYSIVGAFDQFNIRHFELTIDEDEVNFEIARSGWESCERYFFELISPCCVPRIKFIHAIVWLSLASHCWEDYDSMCLAFYNGVRLWNDVLDEGELQ